MNLHMTCVSRFDVPYTLQGRVVKGHPPGGCAICQALSSEEWMFHVSPLAMFMQPIGGAGGSLTDPDCICSGEGYPALGVRDPIEASSSWCIIAITVINITTIIP